MRFFSEEIILFLWARFCKECAWVFAAVKRIDAQRSEFFRTVKFIDELRDL